MSRESIPVLYKDKEGCIGCGACMCICPKGAVSMMEDEEGFLYPQIDEKECVGCLQCVKACPINRSCAHMVVT